VETIYKEDRALNSCSGKIDLADETAAEEGMISIKGIRTMVVVVVVDDDDR
jgi:hypothetical protein